MFSSVTYSNPTGKQMESQELSPPYLQFFSIPVMGQKKFADLAGVTEGVLEGWINRGYIPTIKIGKHTLINLVGLTQACIERIQSEE